MLYLLFIVTLKTIEWTLSHNFVCVLCTGCYQGESSRAAAILHQTRGRRSQDQSHHWLRQAHCF